MSSRKQANVDRTVQELKSENLAVDGMVCHVGKTEDRQNLVKEVRTIMIHNQNRQAWETKSDKDQTASRDLIV